MKSSKWTTPLAEISKQFDYELKDLSPSQLSHKPNPKNWSIAQILDHLIKVNESYYPLIQNYRVGKMKLPLLARFDWMVKWMGNFIHQYVRPENRKKTKTFAIWEPSFSDVEEGIVHRFDGHQKELIRFMEDCEDLLVRDIIIHSPANRNIIYHLSKAFDIILDHERRHLQQIRDLKSQVQQHG